MALKIIEGDFKADDYQKWYAENYLAFNQIDLNDSSSKAQLGKLVADNPAIFSQASYEELITIRQELETKLSNDLGKYTIKNLELMVSLEGVPEKGLLNMLYELPCTTKTSEQEYNDVASMIEKFKKATSDEKEQNKYLEEEIKKVDPAFKEIILTHGAEAILKYSIMKLQSNIQTNFIKEGKFNKNKYSKFLKANASYFKSQVEALSEKA
ncbi:MAG: hypothetical protein Q7S33_04005 [Nanoarchaeota archaeon]|nr:hypothetical protein [Nanoarchaeota archaeon]